METRIALNEREALLIVTALGVCQNRVGQHTSWYQRKRQQTLRARLADCAAGSGRMPLAGYCSVLHKMQHDWGYTPQQAEARRPYISCEDLDYNCVKMAAINMAVHGCFGEAICHDSLCEPDKVRLGYIVNESMWPFPTNVPSIRKEMDPMRFVATRLWAMRGSADRKTLDNEPEPMEQREQCRNTFEHCRVATELADRQRHPVSGHRGTGKALHPHHRRLREVCGVGTGAPIGASEE